MADVPLIYLGAGQLPQIGGHSTVLWQARAGMPAELATLEEVVAGRSVHVVLSAADALLTRVTLSRKQARHLERVLPYLLEEQLLQPPDDLWFLADKVRPGGEYPVAAVDRASLKKLIACIEEQGGALQSVKVDADLLSEQAPLVAHLDGQVLLMETRDRALVVPADRVDEYRRLFGDSLSKAPQWQDPVHLLDTLREAGKRDDGIELLQGRYAPSSEQAGGDSPWAPWRPLAVLVASVLFVSLALLWAQQWRYQRASEETFQQAAALYSELFPGERASPALRRQFQAKLQRMKGGAEASAGFLVLLSPVAEVLSEKEVAPKRFQYDQRQGALTVDVSVKDYSQLETLQSAIRQKGPQATIANYRKGAQGINARIKVEQAG